MITPQEYAKQEAERIKAKHETAFDRAMMFLEDTVRGEGTYKLATHTMGEPRLRALEAAKDPEMLGLVVDEFRKRLQKAGWSLLITEWDVERWWRHGYIKVIWDCGF